MTHAGVRIMEGVLPTSIVKDNGRLVVTFSNGEHEIFDTVVAAVGKRYTFLSLSLPLLLYLSPSPSLYLSLSLSLSLSL